MIMMDGHDATWIIIGKTTRLKFKKAAIQPQPPSIQSNGRKIQEISIPSATSQTHNFPREFIIFFYHTLYSEFSILPLHHAHDMNQLHLAASCIQIFIIKSA